MNEPLTITVHGTPAGQGAISFLGKGRPAVHTNRKMLLPWRDAIITAALNITGSHPYAAYKTKTTSTACTICGTAKAEHALFVGVPMAADITVTVEKPKSAPKRRQTWPITRSSSDLDHHVRATLDSLSKAGVFGDDSQVVELSARKVYPGEHLDALASPGAVIRVWQLDVAEVAS